MENITNYIKVYEGSLDNLKKAEVKKGVGDLAWNLHSFVPLQNGETIYIHPDQEGIEGNYVRVIHSEWNCISVFAQSYFQLEV